MNPATKRRAIRAIIDKMVDEYGYSDTWPESYQQEYERLCALLEKLQPQKKGRPPSQTPPASSGMPDRGNSA